MTSAAVLPPAPAIHAPDENWDDDFVFSASNSPRPSDTNRLSAAGGAPRKRPSVTLSETENWDDDFQDDHEPGPSSRRPLSASHSQRRSKGSIGTALENWDDEFEDRSAPSQRQSVAHTREESWDSEDEHHEPQPSSRSQPRTRTANFSSDEDEGNDFGLSAHDEDKTVTSSTRTRFANNDSPAPPLPGTMSPTRPMPVPGSPTLSATLSYTAPSHYSSTAHLALRPTHSAGSSNHAPGRAFIQHQPGVLRKAPPPPASQNGSRARRRLRKKSRPPHGGADDIFEMEDRAERETDEDYQRTRAERLQRLADHVQNFTSTEDDLDEMPDEEDAYIPPVTPEPRYFETSSRPQSVASNIPITRTNHSTVSFNIAATPSSAIPIPSTSPSSGALASSPVRSPILSRLGSVKRWAKGARRLSTAPSDISTPSGTPSGTTDQDSPGRSTRRPMSIAAQRERARSPLGEHANPSLLELKPVGQSQNLQNKKSTGTLHAEESKSKSWFFHKDGGSGIRGHKSRDKLKEPPGAQTEDKNGLEHCPPNLACGDAAVFPRRGSNAGLDEKEAEKDQQAKERRGILGIRRISLLGGHKRHKSVLDEARQPSPPAEPSFATTSMGGFSFPPPQPQPVQSPQIEFQETPPSPPQQPQPVSVSKPAQSRLAASSSEPIVQPSAATLDAKFANSNGQAASLGRNGTPTLEAQRELALRRNSLSDLKALDGGLKIPARISRTQNNLKRDLVLVKEFATCVDQLKHQQTVYKNLLGELRLLLAEPTSPISVSSSSTRLFHLPRAPVRQPEVELSQRLRNIEGEYSIWWECADILIELGGKAPKDADEESLPSEQQSSTGRSTPRDDDSSVRRRERAVTLVGAQAPTTPSSGPPQASPPHNWRASTGRNDLNQRQLHLLKRMLDTPDPSTFVVGSVVGIARPARASVTTQESTVNSAVGGHESVVQRPGLRVDLPEVDERMLSPSPVPSSHAPSSPQEKRRGSKGIHGLRDLLRTFRRQAQTASNPLAAISQAELPPDGSATTSSASMSAHEEGQGTAQRKTRSSTGAQTVVSEQEKSRKKDVHPNSPYGTVGALPAKSPRRPSLASLFRLASGKSKTTRQPSESARRSEDADSSDWDRMESASDLDVTTASIPVPPVPETIRGNKKATFETLRRPRSRSVSRTRGASASRSSVNLPMPSTPPSSKPPVARSRLFGGRPGSRDGPPPPAPSQAFAHANHINASPSRANAKTPTQESELQRLGRERSSTAPSRRPGPAPGSRSVSANHAPPSPVDTLPPLPDFRLAVTPENILPLLEYAKEVSTRLNQCVQDLTAALPRTSMSSTGEVGTSVEHASG